MSARLRRAPPLVALLVATVVAAGIVCCMVFIGSAPEWSAEPGVQPALRSESKEEAATGLGPGAPPSVDCEEEARRESDAEAGLEKFSGLAGRFEPYEFGTYRNMAEVRESALSACLVFQPSKEELVRKSLGWEVDGELVSGVPFSQLMAPGFELDGAALEHAQEARDGYEGSLMQAAERAHDLLRFHAEQYTFESLAKVPIDQGVKRRPAPEDPEERPSHAAFTIVNAGQWKFVVDFRSSDYPEVERALAKIDELRAQRDQAIRNVLR